MTEDSTSGELPTYSVRALAFPHGLRMGKLYDLAQRFLYGNSISARCAISWETHELERLLKFLMPYPRPARDPDLPGAIEKAGLAVEVDLVIKGSCCRDGSGRPRKYPKGGKKFELRKLSKGTLMDGPASNHPSMNKYRALDWFDMQDSGRIFTAKRLDPGD
jgi:hypothetical protein